VGVGELSGTVCVAPLLAVRDQGVKVSKIVILRFWAHFVVSWCCYCVVSFQGQVGRMGGGFGAMCDVGFLAVRSEGP
jgi:hypothetical protein